MKLLFHIFVTYIFISICRSSFYTGSKDNILSFLQEEDVQKKPVLSFMQEEDVQKKPVLSFMQEEDVQSKPVKRADNIFSFMQNEGEEIPKAKPVKKAGSAFNVIRTYSEHSDEKGRSRKDPVLNFVNARRANDEPDLSSSTSSSSSNELKDWKDEWREQWIIKKFEAINATGPFMGDTVNMVGARPWGVPCGDPDQHDMPWGTCVLPMECDAEYRIYRGDFNCGRTEYVCCAVQQSAYDMYQGFDLSFEDSGLRSDSDERKPKGKKSGEETKKSKQREKRRRRNARKKRKRQIKRLISKIQKEIRKIIDRQDKNASYQRKKMTKQLKKFIDMLKAQYRHDRKAVQNIHETEMIKIDDALKKRLNEISMMNHNFVNNATFRDIVVNGTLNRQTARMLVQAYPELEPYVHVNVKRRGGGGGTPTQDYLDYDVEYGFLYY